MTGINIDEIRKEAEKEVFAEEKERAKTKMVEKLRELEVAKQVVSRVENEIDLLAMKIEAGDF